MANPEWTEPEDWAEPIPAGVIDTLTAMPGWAGTEEEAEAVIVALQAERGSLVPVCRKMADDYQTSEKHHPDHVLVPRASFMRMRQLLDGLRPRNGTCFAYDLSKAVDQMDTALRSNDSARERGWSDAAQAIATWVLSKRLPDGDWRCSPRDLLEFIEEITPSLRGLAD